MYLRLDRAHRALPAVLGLITMASVAALLAWDAWPRLFPAGTHDPLAAFALAMIAVAYIAYQIVHRPAPREFLKAVMLSIAFLFWAANQLWSASRLAVVWNDIAIALFVLDVFLVMVGWPQNSPDRSFAETRD
jgi:hypothetical protein